MASKYTANVAVTGFDASVALHDSVVRGFANRPISNGVRLQLSSSLKPRTQITVGDVISVNGYNVRIEKVGGPASGQNPGIYLDLDTSELAGKNGAALMRALGGVYGFPFTDFKGAATYSKVNQVAVTPTGTPDTVTPVDFAWNVQTIGNTSLKIAAAIAALYLLYLAGKYLKLT